MHVLKTGYLIYYLKCVSKKLAAFKSAIGPLPKEDWLSFIYKTFENMSNCEELNACFDDSSRTIYHLRILCPGNNKLSLIKRQ